MQRNIFLLPNIDSHGPRSIRIRNIVKNLKKIGGHENIVLKYSKKGVREQSEDVLLRSNWLYYIFSTFKLFHIIRIIYPPINKLGVLSIFTRINISEINKIIKKYNADTLIVVVSPFTSLLLIPAIREKNPQLKIVLDIGDPLYTNSARSNNDKKSFNIENKAVKASNCIIVTNEETKAFYHKTYQITPDKIVVIPQAVDIDLIEESRKKLSSTKKSKPNILYAGRFYTGLRSPKYIFDFIAKQNKYILDVYGRKNKTKIRNVHFRGRLSHQELFKKMHQADYLLFIDNSEGIQTSGKIYELLAFRKLIIFLFTSNETQTYQVAKNYPNVIFIENTEENVNMKMKELGFYEEDVKWEYDVYPFSWEERTEIYSRVIS